jgi:hypothetical protein
MAMVIGGPGRTACEVEAGQLGILETNPWWWVDAVMFAAALVLGPAARHNARVLSWAFSLGLAGALWLLAGAAGLAAALGRLAGERISLVAAGLETALAAGSGLAIGSGLAAAAPRRIDVMAAAAAALALAAGYRMSAAATGARRISAGIDGEREAARSLASLPDDYVVLHELRLPGDDGRCEIDHIVLGPTGLFVLETKRWSGQITPGPEVWTQTSRHGSVQHTSPARQLERGRLAVARAIGAAPGAIVPIIVLSRGRLADGSAVPVRVETPAGAAEAIARAASTWPLSVGPREAARTLLAAAK